MTSVYTGQDIIKFTYGKETRVINDLADNDVVQITYPNDVSSTDRKSTRLNSSHTS